MQKALPAEVARAAGLFENLRTYLMTIRAASTTRISTLKEGISIRSIGTGGGTD
jgi:hypothetical protein